jgi:hypothetical protein
MYIYIHLCIYYVYVLNIYMYILHIETPVKNPLKREYEIVSSTHEIEYIECDSKTQSYMPRKVLKVDEHLSVEKREKLPIFGDVFDSFLSG